MQFGRTRRWRAAIASVGVVVMAATVAHAAHQGVRRTLGSYFILGLREVGIKNLDLRSDLGVCSDPATAFLNIGVNCEQGIDVPHCGNLRMETARVFSPGAASQVVADTIRVPKPGGSLFGVTTTLDQVFRNDLAPLPAEVIINDPPEQTVTLPIIPGTCDALCEPDIDAVKALCDFPAPFPACDQNASFTIRAGADCLPYDTNLGNGICDLPPGTYGFVKMAASGAHLIMQAGDYVFCTFKAGTGSRLVGNGAEMQVVGGRIGIGNLTSIGLGCGDLTIVANGTKSISFGKDSAVAANVCAPQAHLRLGHNNSLTGRFVGMRVSADRDNVGHVCCN
jgi:hypothetical protein